MVEDETKDVDKELKPIIGGIQGYRYKDLRDFIPNCIGNLKLMAKELQEVNWK